MTFRICVVFASLESSTNNSLSPLIFEFATKALKNADKSSGQRSRASIGALEILTEFFCTPEYFFRALLILSAFLVSQRIS